MSEASGSEGRSQEPAPKRVSEEAQERFEGLQGGRSVDLLGEPLSIRSVKAVAIFIAVFAAVLLVVWLLLGGIGMAIGALLGAGAGVWALKAYSDRVGSPPGDDRPSPSSEPDAS